MKTITFYSYKGGVGRSLTLANMAIRLAEFGKSVCMIDFDLEAPGLHVKFQEQTKQPITMGLVNYIHSYAREGILPPSIMPYCTKLWLYSNDNVHLISAGNIHSSEYWRLLSGIDWYNLVYENPNSIAFFLDLKQKIKKELNPDFLLIDSRTGISEMSGITISLMADEVIIVSANNKENLEGSKRIINFLLDDQKALSGKTPKISFVLSRIPYPDTPADRGKEQQLVSKIKKELSSVNPKHFFVLHSDRELEMDEKMKIGLELDPTINVVNKSVQITKEYLELFEHITADILTPAEKIKFENIKLSDKLFVQAFHMPGSKRKIELLERALELNEQNINIHLLLGDAYIEAGQQSNGLLVYENMFKKNLNLPDYAYVSLAYAYLGNNLLAKSAEMFLKVIKLFPSESHRGYIGLGNICNIQKDHIKAINYYTHAIEENENSNSAYTNRANAYILLGKYQEAQSDVFKALEIDPDNAFAYITLAEIKAIEGKENEFYINLEIALSKDATMINSLIQTDKLYTRFFTEERFIKLLEKYDIPLPEHKEGE